MMQLRKLMLCTWSMLICVLIWLSACILSCLTPKGATINSTSSLPFVSYSNQIKVFEEHRSDGKLRIRPVSFYYSSHMSFRVNAKGDVIDELNMERPIVYGTNDVSGILQLKSAMEYICENSDFKCDGRHNTVNDSAPTIIGEIEDSEIKRILGMRFPVHVDTNWKSKYLNEAALGFRLDEIELSKQIDLEEIEDYSEADSYFGGASERIGYIEVAGDYRYYFVRDAWIEEDTVPRLLSGLPMPPGYAVFFIVENTHFDEGPQHVQ